MIIYRVEIFCEDKKQYIGPYRIKNYDLHPLSLGLNNKRYKHPMPNDDNIMDYEIYHYFGFQSMKDLYSWFYSKEIRQNMNKYHTIAIYDDRDSSDTLIGKKQLAFNIHKSILISRIPFMKTYDSSLRKSEKIVTEYENEG